MKIQQVITRSGQVGRKNYLLWGLLLFAIKYNLDRLIARYFGKKWFIVDYFVHSDVVADSTVIENDSAFYITLLLFSIPFIWAGTNLSLKRLRDTKIEPWVVIFFFLPYINLLFFLILSILPSAADGLSTAFKAEHSRPQQSKYASAALALVIVVPITLGVSYLMVEQLKEYGWSLFVGVPFFLGFGSVLIFASNRSITYKEALAVMLASVMFFSTSLFVLAFEGILCLIMAFPIMLLIGYIGATLAYAIQFHNKRDTASTAAFPLMAILFLAFLEEYSDYTPPTKVVQSEVVIVGSKQQIWNELVAFSEIEKPTEWLFATGIAYPTHAEIEGRGVGAVRKCNFTTGTFIEPITVWDEPNLLAFSVLDQPPPMVEWSIYNDLAIEHLDGYFQSSNGEFRLETMSDNTVKLIGSTWYKHDIWPTFYWSIYSEFILHKIHLRVLNHIKKKVETIEQ